MDVNKIFEIVKKGFEFIKGIGFDVIIIVALGMITEILKQVLRTKKIVNGNKWIPILICFMIGIPIGILQVVCNKIEPVNWLRVVLGYPAFTVGAYMFIDKFINKKKTDGKK